MADVGSRGSSQSSSRVLGKAKEWVRMASRDAASLVAKRFVINTACGCAVAKAASSRMQLAASKLVFEKVPSTTYT